MEPEVSTPTGLEGNLLSKNEFDENSLIHVVIPVKQYHTMWTLYQEHLNK